MFKGLKSKLEDEAKKLQASVQQYGEHLSQQVGQYRNATVRDISVNVIENSLREALTFGLNDSFRPREFARTGELGY